MLRKKKFKKASEHRILEKTEPTLKPLDYCTMVQDSNLSDSELADRLGIETRLVQRMRDLDYVPKDKELQAKILALYLEE